MDGVVNLTLAAGSTSHGDIVDLDGLNEDSSLDLRDPTGASISLPHGGTNFTVGAGATWSGVIRGINDTTVEDGGNAVSNGPATVTGNVATGTNSTVTYNSTATIEGGVSTGSGSAMTFNGETTIGDSSDPGSGNVSGTGSTLTFNGTTTINNTVSGTNSTLTFGGNTAIGNGISGKIGRESCRERESTNVKISESAET